MPADLMTDAEAFVDAGMARLKARLDGLPFRGKVVHVEDIPHLFEEMLRHCAEWRPSAPQEIESETVHYADGTSATGPVPLPRVSPDGAVAVAPPVAAPATDVPTDPPANDPAPPPAAA